jgi:glutathione S-transferase
MAQHRDHAQETPMKLYSGPLSLFTAKVRVALDEKALAYERIDVGWSLAHRYEPHHPDVMALNPKQQVPVLVDGDVVVYDSTQILEYLEDAYPQPALRPADVAGRARCRRLEASADEQLFPLVWNLIEEAFYPAANGVRDEARLADARTAIAAHYDGLDAELKGRAYFCGDFSYADIATFIFVQAASGLGSAPADDQLAFCVWLDRMRERPAVRREVDAMNAFIASLLAPKVAASR